MVPGRRRTRATRSAAPSPTAGELAVHAAEAIVARAWAEQLLRYYDRADYAYDAARKRCEAAVDRLVTAQRAGDPGEISLAHAALEQAMDACRTSEVAREQGRRALQAALDALAHRDGDRTDSAKAGGEGDGEPVPTIAPVVGPGPSTRQRPTGVGAVRAARRALSWFGRRRAHSACAPGQP